MAPDLEGTVTAPPRALGAQLAVAAVLAAALVMLAPWIAEPRDALVGHTVTEDAFYYFQTARNVARGAGSVSSGGIAHNGYHPLWMLASAAAFRLAPATPAGDLAAIRAILCLGAILFALSGLVLWRILRALGVGPWAAAFAVACYALNPWGQKLAIGGLEAPANALLIALLVLATLPERLRGARPAAFAWAGLLTALVYLVRTDNVFFLAATWGWAAWGLRGRPGAGRGLALAAGVAAAGVAPWIAWNAWRFGAFFQGSASALPVVRRLAFLAEHPGGNLLRFRAGLLADWFPATLYYTGLGSYWLGLGALTAAVWAGRRILRRPPAQPPFGPALAALAPLFAAVLCLGVAHKFVRLATREWYYVTSDVALALLLGVTAGALLRTARSRAAVAVLAVVLTAPAFGKLALETRRHYRDRLALPRAYALDIADAIGRLPGLAPGETVGVTDSGTVGFFAPHPAVNLDGVVNPEAARAIAAGQLLGYVRAKGIRYVVVTPRMQRDAFWGAPFAEALEPWPPLTAQGFRVRPATDAPPPPPDSATPR